MKDPVRLLTGGPPEIQDLLRSASIDAPLRPQLDQLAAKLAPTIAAPASAALVPWLLTGVALLGAAGVIVLARDRHATTPPPAAIAQRAEPPSPQPEIVMPSVAIVSPTEPAPAPTTKRKESTEQRVKKPLPVIANEPARQPSPPVVPRELDLLTPAHAALHANELERALVLAERHASLYPTGTFAEEREAVAIEALYRLGQHERARVRLTSFTGQYPRSGYRTRLERMVRE